MSIQYNYMLASDSGFGQVLKLPSSIYTPVVLLVPSTQKAESGDLLSRSISAGTNLCHNKALTKPVWRGMQQQTSTLEEQYQCIQTQNQSQ